MRKYDIIVIGGGFAGAAAAISAARCGANVLLVEKSGSLGGAATNCLVNPFMPYYTNIEGQRTNLSAGLFAEIHDRLIEMRNATGEIQNIELDRVIQMERVIHQEHLKILLDRMAVEAGVNLLFHAYLCDVSTEAGKISAITVVTKAGNIELAADYFIDATGDGDLAVLAGCSYRLGRESDSLCQPMTLCFRLGNVDIEKYREEFPHMQKLYKQYQAEGKIKNPRENILVFPTFQTNVLHFNTTRIIKLNPVDPFDVTRAEIESREQIMELFMFLKENFVAFQNAELVHIAAEIGVRESRMIDGLYLLTGTELRDCARFEDSIACGNYDIDIHNPEGTGTSHYYFPAGEYYQIPYRSLVAKDFSNLLIAGRCLSADHEAQASVRIMPIVCCLGEAAGVGAFVASQNGTTAADADIREIQRILIENGARIF